MSTRKHLYDTDRTLAGAVHAIERARSRGVELIEPDDLLAGLLLAISRFGIVDLGTTAIDLEALGLRFDLPASELSVKPSYSPTTSAAFDRAARIARADGARAVAPIHLLVALGDAAIPTFARITERYALDSPVWRRLLAEIQPPQENAIPPSEAQQSSFDALLSPDEAAAALGVHIQTLRGYIRSGKLPAFRVAGERALRIRRDDLAGLLEHLSARPSNSAVPDENM